MDSVANEVVGTNVCMWNHLELLRYFVKFSHW